MRMSSWGGDAVVLHVHVDVEWPVMQLVSLTRSTEAGSFGFLFSIRGVKQLDLRATVALARSPYTLKCSWNDHTNVPRNPGTTLFSFQLIISSAFA